jgi:hypothetical protein
MKARKIVVICPFSRPEFQQNVFDNFTQQTFHGKELVIVENGESVGKWKLPATQILNSNKHQASAKNTGLLYVGEKFPDALWTTFDDDDYYGPGYLEELAENSDKADVIGKANIFMKSKSGKLRFIDICRENEYSNYLWGCSISSWVKDINFPYTGVWGEDNTWLDIAESKGLKIYATSRYNAYINRCHERNTWRTTDQNIVNTSNKVVEYEFDIDVINNKKQAQGKELQRSNAFDFSHVEEQFNLSDFEKFIDGHIEGELWQRSHHQ